MFCDKPWTGFEVEHDGTVQRCCMAKSGSGSIHEQSIEEIWNGEHFQELRRKMADGRWEEICRPECPRLYGQFQDAAPIPRARPFAENYRINQMEIERRAEVLDSWPRFWKLTHSTQCNLNCVMCYQDRNDLRSLPDRFYQEIVEYYPVIQEIQLIGGEPFAIKRYRDFLADFPQSRLPDVHFAFVTNGTIHDWKTISIVRGLQVSWFSISVDAATDAIYERIRRGGNFAHTSDGIRKWISLGREMNFPVVLSFTVMKDNVHQMPEFVQFTHDRRLDCLFGKFIGMRGRQHIIDEAVFESSLSKARAVAARYKAEMPLANLTLTALYRNSC